MKVILLKDIAKVGKKYDVKDVADGYALNMLIPRGYAKVATEQSLRSLDMLKQNDLTDKKIQTELLIKNLETIKNLKITLKEKANDKGVLFAGVTKETLVNEIMKETRLNIDPSSIMMNKPLKEVGEHKVTVEALGKQTQFTVNIESK
ncbi:50S ribosomal protein L9 [Patescibacteria group bacterium]|nr:50S ribosomal protein L9 [Patescibacteria group bacterium]